MYGSTVKNFPINFAVVHLSADHYFVDFHSAELNSTKQLNNTIDKLLLV